MSQTAWVPEPAIGEHLERTVVLVTCGRHDRGLLFPKAKRRIENLLPPLRKAVGEFGGNCLLCHDGSRQAEETVKLMSFPVEANQGERDFLAASYKQTPEEYEMNKAFRLIQQTDKDLITLVLDSVYAASFASFCLEKIGKAAEKLNVSEGDAIVIQADGTCQLISPPD